MGRAFAFIVAVVVWALVFRLMVLPLAYDRMLTGDPASYVNIATNILAGDGMVRDNSAVIGGALRAYYPPLYPLLLVGLGLLVLLVPLTFLALNFLIDIAAAGALFWLSRVLGLSPRLGLAASSAYLLWPTSIIMAPVANKEGLASLLAILMFGFLVQRRAVGFGLFAGLLALAQPALLTLPIIAGIVLDWRGGWLRAMLVAAGVAALVMLPWWIRNYTVLCSKCTSKCRA